MAAKAAGVTGDLDSLCAGSCGVLGSIGGALKQLVNPCPKGSHKEKTVTGAPLVRDLRGATAANSKGQIRVPSDAPFAVKAAVSGLNRAIGYLPAGYCVDDNDPKHIIGVLSGVPPAFTAYELRLGAKVEMPPVVPVSPPTGSPIGTGWKPHPKPRGPQGGVTVH